MSARNQLCVLPVRQRKSCCEECSLCYCRCFLSISVVLAIIFTVSGGVLVYNFGIDRTDKIAKFFGFQDSQEEFLRGLGYLLIVLGSIMVICVFISASYVCCLTNSPINQPGVIIVNQPADVMSLPLAPISVPTAPIEPPPSYESISQVKV